jgi:hypothetical protein
MGLARNIKSVLRNFRRIFLCYPQFFAHAGRAESLAEHAISRVPVNVNSFPARPLQIADKPLT